MSPAIQKILIGFVVILVLGYLGFNLYIKDPDPSAVGIQSDELAGQDIIILVGRLQNVTIDKTIFTSEVFKSLVDFRVSLFPESQGRINPFASITGENTASVNTSVKGSR